MHTRDKGGCRFKHSIIVNHENEHQTSTGEVVDGVLSVGRTAYDAEARMVDPSQSRMRDGGEIVILV